VFSESAAFYDAIYGAFKDYRAESARVAAMLRSVQPTVCTVLDAACGTGEHVRFLRADNGLLADGLDMDPGLLAVARRKVPDAEFFEADMSSFALRRKYDAIVCLFSSIGYLRTLDRVTAALTCFRQHLNPTGVIVVEPWFAPGVLRLGTTDTKRGEVDGVGIARTSHVAVDGRLSTITFDYELTGSSGVRHVREIHELGLFTPEEMLSCFRDAGLSASFDAEGLTGRGLYTARRPGRPLVRAGVRPA
jgi:SAM-dependent methyltransferase